MRDRKQVFTIISDNIKCLCLQSLYSPSAKTVCHHGNLKPESIFILSPLLKDSLTVMNKSVMKSVDPEKGC